MDKYAICVLKGKNIVGHLKNGDCGCFAKTIFYFLQSYPEPECIAKVTGKNETKMTEKD